MITDDKSNASPRKNNLLMEYSSREINREITSKLLKREIKEKLLNSKIERKIMMREGMKSDELWNANDKSKQDNNNTMMRN